MPDEETLERAREDAAEGKAPSTQAGEFVKEEMDHIREDQAGDRHRTVEGSPCRNQVAASGQRHGVCSHPHAGRA